MEMWGSPNFLQSFCMLQFYRFALRNLLQLFIGHFKSIQFDTCSMSLFQMQLQPRKRFFPVVREMNVASRSRRKFLRSTSEIWYPENFLDWRPRIHSYVEEKSWVWFHSPLTFDFSLAGICNLIYLLWCPPVVKIGLLVTNFQYWLIFVKYWWILFKYWQLFVQ